MQVPATGGYGNYVCTFMVRSHCGNGWALCTLSYYHNSTPQCFYVHKTSNYTFGYNKNDDNTVDIYMYISTTYTPSTITILSSYRDHIGTLDYNPYLSDTLPETVTSTPTYTEFSSLL